MRPISFALAFAFLITGPLVHREPGERLPNRLPGVGTFTYTGTPLAGDELQHIVLAAVH